VKYNTMAMKQYDETNRWNLFPEENKKNESGPDFTGELDINGAKYRLAGWKNISKKTGKKFLAGEIEPKDGKNDKQTKRDFDDPLEDF